MHAFECQTGFAGWCKGTVCPHRRATSLAITFVLSLIMGGITPHPTLAAAPPGSKQPADIDYATYFDANSLLMFVTNTGSFAYDKDGLFGKNDGLYFPLGEGRSVVFAAGLWLGAKVNDEVRVTVAEFSDEFVPGPMSGGTFQPDDPDFRVYKINSGDTRFTNPDYAGWPYGHGAPALKDHQGNDSLDAQGFRIPLLLGDQALWAVFNDADPDAHTNRAGSTLPLGVEVQLYAYGDDESCPSGRTIKLRYTIINKSSDLLEDTYVSFWADPDLGYAGDDLVGCDSLHSLGFAYNDSTDATYGAAPPAVGFGIVQGPIVPSPGDSAWRSSTGHCLYDFANLPMTAFSRFIIYETYPNSPSESYNYMQGLDQLGDPVVNPGTGLTTKYMCSGDPVTSTGWLDTNPADRQYLVSSGPFDMAPDDTQEVVMAVMVGQGTQQFGYVGDTVFATHVAGLSLGSAYAVVVDETATTGHDYRITLELALDMSEYIWSIRDVTDGIDVVTDLHNQDGGDDYPLLDGLVVKLINPRPGVGDWDVPSGERRITWAGGADLLGFEGFYGAIGWDSPHHRHGGGPPGVPLPQIKNVELRLATADENGVFDPGDPNVSYAYRYGRTFDAAPARPEFAPFIVNTAGGYAYQDFTKSVPLSAWDMDANPPRRLAVGHLENNVPDGMVDGIYWPPSHDVADNGIGTGPREWLWIFDTDYGETANALYEVEAIGNPLPIMYWLTVARRWNVPFETGDEFAMFITNHNTEADVFEFTAPDPVIMMAGGIPACWPGETLASLTALGRVSSLAQSEFECSAGECDCPSQCDFDDDGFLTALDLGEMIDILFAGHDDLQDPLCPSPRADFDCDGFSTALDLGALIDHLFAGGTEPCDPCTE